MHLRRLAVLTALPLALAACDATGLKLPGFGTRAPDAAAPATTAPAAATPPAVSPLEQAIEVGAGTPVGTANAETLALKSFAAQGAGWSAVASGDAVAFARDGAKTLRVPARRIDFAAGTEFAGNIGNSAFSLTIRAADCADGSPMTATARVAGGGSFSGCARPATAEQVAGIARAAAAPAPKQAAVAPAKPKAAAKPKRAAAPAAPATPGPTTAPAAPTPTPAAPGAGAIVIPGGPTSLPATPTLGTSAPVIPTTTPAATPAPTPVATPTPTPTPAP